MVINVMEKRKQVNTKRNVGQQAKHYFHRGSGKLSSLFYLGRNLKAVKD